MYATIPEDAEAIQPKNRAPARRGFGLVVALCVGVLIGALGTMVLMVGGPEAPSPPRAAMELNFQSCKDIVQSCACISPTEYISPECLSWCFSPPLAADN